MAKRKYPKSPIYRHQIGEHFLNCVKLCMVLRNVHNSVPVMQRRQFRPQTPIGPLSLTSIKLCSHLDQQHVLIFKMKNTRFTRHLSGAIASLYI
jgi:hypothetical protein